MANDTHEDKQRDEQREGGPAAREQRERQDGDHIFAMRDLVDMQLVTADGKRIGRVADVDCAWCADGALALICLRTGPQALARRFGALSGKAARFVFRDRFERQITLDEIAEVGLEVRLRGRAEDYAVGQSERWLVAHVLRFIPGSGI
jgi:hypothetical protein